MLGQWMAGWFLSRLSLSLSLDHLVSLRLVYNGFHPAVDRWRTPLCTLTLSLSLNPEHSWASPPSPLENSKQS
jgi:hypothetical protein